MNAMKQRRVIGGLLAAVVCGLTAPTAGAASWRLEQPAPPPPPEGVAAAPFEVPLGGVSDIQFWAPNRGLMAVAGSGTSGGPVKAGLYSYDGASWTPLSTVCGGGSTTRIAWAGPREFWTVADARADRQAQDPKPRNGSTLCHFKDGVVVASYATANTDPDGYLTMRAAACRAADDCWFAGSVLEAPRAGAFHLHWDGTRLSRIDAPQGRPVRDLTAFDGRLFEALAISDDFQPPRLTTPEVAPILVRQIAANASSAASITPDPFLPTVAGTDPVDAVELSAMDADAARVWAAGGRAGSGPSGVLADQLASGPLLAVRPKGGAFQQVPLDPSALSPDPAAPATSFRDIAVEPGTDTAWAILDTAQPTVVQLRADGTVLRREVIPAADDPDPNTRGDIGPLTRIACASAGNCWLATGTGWLFHLAEAAPATVDSDPLFKRLITVRPDDGATPTFVSDAAPVDDSGTDLGPRDLPVAPPEEEAPLAEEPAAPQARRVKVRTLSRTAIQISFRLTAKARVRASAFYGKKLAARTPRRVLRKGNHVLILRVTPKRWPTRIKLEVLAPK